VAEAHRGSRLGTRLLEELAAAARAAGFARLSLSVDEGNPAVRLYERLGYEELSRDEGGIRMICEL
jgi:ribosomal protein S18 acetylase RimI-like enzyme